MYQIVFIRHGESLWSDKFTGWTDIDITPKGIALTYQYGKKLKEKGFQFDLGISSYLKRGIRTLWTVLDAMDLMWIPTLYDWRLNERHYGALQGLNKAETAEKYGADQVKLWRRSFDIPPPKLTRDDPRYSGNDIRYKDLTPEQIPLGESLKETSERTISYWTKTIIPLIKQGKKIILSAHSNSLRSIFMHLDNLTPEQVFELNIPYCIPLIYQFDEEMKLIGHYYLASDEVVREAIESVKNQANKKQ